MGIPILTSEGFAGQRMIIDDYFLAGHTLLAGDVVAIQKGPTGEGSGPRVYKVYGSTSPKRIIGVVHTPSAKEVGDAVAEPHQYVSIVVQGVAKALSARSLDIGDPVTPSGNSGRPSGKTNFVARVGLSTSNHDSFIGRCLTKTTGANQVVDILVDIAGGYDSTVEAREPARTATEFDPPTGFAVAAGDIGGKLDLAWTNSTNFDSKRDYHQVQHRESGTTDWLPAVPVQVGGESHSLYLLKRALQEVQLRTVYNDADGNEERSSTWVTGTGTPLNNSPIANAGPLQSVARGDTVTLDASGSSDLDGDSLTYSWSKITGPTLTLSDDTAASPTFTAPSELGALLFEVTVSDGQGGSSKSRVSVHIVNQAPTANAGSDVTADVGNTVNLDASGSSDPDSDSLTYSWSQSADDAVAVTLTGADTATPSFTAPASPTTLNFTVTVSNDHGGSATDDVTITVQGANQAPTASAGPDQSVNSGDTVTLDGSGSSDPDTGDTLIYSWFQTSGTTVSLSDANAVQPTFTAPSSAATLEFRLTVTDGRGGAATDYVTITVQQPNQAPTADAGPDQSVNRGAQVTLNGSGSSDLLNYSWSQDANNAVAVTLANPTGVSPTFTAPSSPTTLNFTLTVSDSALSATDDVTITVQNRAPTAHAGDDQRPASGATVTLDGSGSSDPEGDTLTYNWEQLLGSPVTLSDATAVSPTFTMPSHNVSFRLTVTDSHGDSDVDFVVIRLQEPNQAPTADAGPDQSVDSQATATLDGSGSSDPNSGDTLSYSWEQLSGTTVTLSDGSIAQPTFTAPYSPAVLSFRLTVTDSQGATDSDEVTITVETGPVVVNAGQDLTVQGGVNVSLFGTTNDPEEEITFLWTQVSGTNVTLSTTTSNATRFTSPTTPGTLVFRLTVTAASGRSASDDVTVTVRGPNRAPVADAGPDQTISLGTPSFYLDASGSSDPEGDTMTYSWTQISGTTVTIGGATHQKPVVLTPSTAGTLVFEVTVTDYPYGLSDTDTVTITVVDNQAPTADAGPDQDVVRGVTVALDGTGSSDPDSGDTISHSWSQTQGPTVTLSDDSIAQPTFTAPLTLTTLVFQLTVTDNHGATDTDNVTITTQDDSGN